MQVDVAIVGAGPAGLSLARGLAGTGLEVAIVERLPESALADPGFDGREVALTHLSQDILRRLGAWALIPQAEVSPLREARVLSGPSPYALQFEPPSERHEVLGRLVPNHLIRRALFGTVRGQPGLTLLAGAEVAEVATTEAGGRLRLADGRQIRARLVVAADTRFSEARARMGIGAERVEFGKTMLVSRLAHERPHGHVATEWFGYGQTLAMLPLNGNVSSAVLTLRPEEVARLQAMDEEAFGAEITRRWDGRLGRMRAMGSRHAYPLVATYAERFAARRFALLGDAAVGMHPVTAHGFNFGLRGAHVLAGEIRAAAARGLDIASPGLLRRYEAAHRNATRLMYLGTNAIARLYTDDRLPARLLRGVGLRLGNRLPPVRRAVLSKLMEARPAVG